MLNERCPKRSFGMAFLFRFSPWRGMDKNKFTELKLGKSFQKKSDICDALHKNRIQQNIPKESVSTQKHILPRCERHGCCEQPKNPRKLGVSSVSVHVAGLSISTLYRCDTEIVTPLIQDSPIHKMNFFTTNCIQ